MEEIARVYSEALFDVAKEKDSSTRCTSSSASSPTRSRPTATCRSSSSAPTSPRRRSGRGSRRRSRGGNAELVNFLELLAEKHRMPALFRIRKRFDELWAKENKRLEVTVTSAVELDPAVVESIGAEIEKKTGKTIELTSEVDDSIIGGLVLQVGNRVLDASIRNRLDKLRKSCAGRLSGPRPRDFSNELRTTRSDRADGNQARRDLLDPAPADRGPGDRQRRPRRGRNRALGRRRNRPRPRPRQLHVAGDARAAPRRHRPRPQPRGGQRRRRALRRLGADRRGRHGQAHRPACSRSRSARSCSAAWSTRSAARSTARATSTPPRPARPSSRPRA